MIVLLLISFIGVILLLGLALAIAHMGKDVCKCTKCNSWAEFTHEDEKGAHYVCNKCGQKYTI